MKFLRILVGLLTISICNVANGYDFKDSCENSCYSFLERKSFLYKDKFSESEKVRNLKFAEMSRIQ